MNRAKIVRECKALFPVLRPVNVAWIDAQFPEAEKYFGLFCPGGIKHTDRHADTIILNLWYIRFDGDKESTEHLARGTLIHEFIHCEQWTMGYDPSHGNYFNHRRAELHAKTGIIIP